MRKTVYISCLLLIISSCKKEKFTINNLNGNKISILGQGGVGLSNAFPENSLESIASCLKIGAKGAEIDVQVTKDGALVAYNGIELSSSTNGNGKIHEHDWNEIKSVKYNSLSYGNYPLVSLEKIFNSVKDHSKHEFMLDVQLNPREGSELDIYHESLTNTMILFFNKHQLYEHVFVTSSSASFLSILKSKAPDIEIYYSTENFASGLSEASNNAYKGIRISNNFVSKEQITQAHNQGIFVSLTDIDSKKKNIEAVRKSPDLIQTKKVRHLVNLLK